jgi:uncharacterized membrane protein YeaQ/YmgE (transglycosylase-associated protein family)
MDTQTIISFLVSLIAGGAGGNIVGALLKNRTLGPMLNTVLGIVGGGIGGQVLGNLDVFKNVVSALGSTGGNATLSAILGALLPLIVSFLKKPATANA